jgi:hypothetical protein
MSYYDPDTDETLYDVLQSLVEADEDTNPWDSVYEIDGMTVIATAFMLLVLQKLNASPYWHYFEWNGETSDQIVGIPMCYAWEAPASIQQLNEDAIKSAFIDIFTEFNVTIDPNTVGDHELENWG